MLSMPERKLVGLGQQGLITKLTIRESSVVRAHIARGVEASEPRQQEGVRQVLGGSDSLLDLRGYAFEESEHATHAH